MRVLVIEDGFEYIEMMTRFAPPGVQLVRAGSGPAALASLGESAWDAAYLDMCFDRVEPAELLGDVAATADRFNGDTGQAVAWLENHQGNYILAAIREAGHELPVLMSYDFEAEPRRFARLRSRFGPLAYVPDNGGPADVVRLLRELVTTATGRS